ncbi:MAG: alkaline phosphatase [Zetaproteobacteria bacterium]|nr:alkaline phosphatase [Zetaproteobacteria bacterium]
MNRRMLKNQMATVQKSTSNWRCRISQLTCSALLLCNTSHAQGTPPQLGPAKNAIFFIGDGMGIAAITGGRIWKKDSTTPLAMEKLPTLGMVKTYSSSDFVTDSAASATALATGVKTRNGMLSMSDPDLDPSGKSRPLETLFDLAHQAGKSLGIISTARVTHATPAAFYAHVDDRDKEENIAEQLLDAPLALLMGGGRQAFTTTRKDGRDLLKELKQQHWHYVGNRDQLTSLTLKKGEAVLGLFADSHMDYDLENRLRSPRQPSLTEMVQFAMRYLSTNEKGYVLMVEAGRIDHAAHVNRAQDLFGDLVALDEAVAYAEQHKTADTLTVITADHETGGLALNGYKDLPDTKGDGLLSRSTRTSHPLVTFATGPGETQGKYQKPNDMLLFQHPSLYAMESAAHTAVDVPILAGGPGATAFSGFIDNDDIAPKIAQALGLSFTATANQQNFKLLSHKK